jgi:hypothetical protein
MAFIGTPLDTRNTFQSLVGKRFDGDGSTTDFTLDVAPGSVLDIEVFVGNVRQDPNSAYTLSGTTLSFTGAPPSGTNNIYVVHQAKSVGTIDVPAGGVQAGSLATGVLTGQTDIGGAIADADLFLLDDGAGGTLRKTAASRIKTYAGFSVSDITGATELAATPADTDELIISDAGTLKRIDYSYLKSANSGYFMAYRDGTNESPSAATFTAYIYNAEHTDGSSAYNTTNGEYTAPSAGRYFFESQFWASQIDDAQSCQIAHYFDLSSAGSFSNNTARTRIGLDRGTSTDQGPAVRVATLVDLAAGDKVKTYVYVSSGGIFANSSYNYFLGFKLA